MLYVIELLNHKGEWTPTVAVSFSSHEAEFILMPEWQKKFPNDEFRVKKYARIGR